MQGLEQNIEQVMGPLSAAIIPVVQGLSRRVMLRRGAVEEVYRLAGTSVHLYRRPARVAAAQEQPLLLIHGIADSATTWAFLLHAFTDIGTVYALDLPGFGQSGYPPGQRYASIRQQAAVLRELIEQVIGRPVLVVGNSMGGLVAGRLALEQPQLFSGVIMLDPGGALLSGRESWESFVSMARVPDLRTVRAIYRQMFGRVNPMLYLAQRSFQALFARDAVRHILEETSEEEFFTPDELGRIRVPVGLVWGSKDSFLPPGSFEFFRDHLPPGSTLLMLPGCGHLPQQERPRKVVQFVREFARRKPSPPSPFSRSLCEQEREGRAHSDAVD